MESSSKPAVELKRSEWTALRKASQGQRLTHHQMTALQRLGLLQVDLLDGKLRLTQDGRAMLRK